MILHGDCLEKLRTLADNSVDAVVTDPPYGLRFMNRHWDYDVPSVEVWRECLRVLKPGGHMLVACGTRTQHRMVVNMEDAGFEIRDVVTWLYGQGFPKSLDVSKAIDKEAGATREVLSTVIRSDKRSGNFHGASEQRPPIEHAITAPATDAAREWEGWGTALKPACEFWTLCRKPLSEPTVAKNVLKWGTGAINVDGCRVETDEKLSFGSRQIGDGNKYNPIAPERMTPGVQNAQGRFPANLILDEEAAAALDAQSGITKSSPRVYKDGEGDTEQPGGWKTGKRTAHVTGATDSGGASRFFYVAKASKSDRNRGCEEVLTWESVDPSLLDQTALSSQRLKATYDATTPPQNVPEWSTSSCGRGITDLFQMGCKSTTSTASRPTTVLRIWSALLRLSTRESILDAIRMLEANGLSLAALAESTSEPTTISTDVATASVLDASHALFDRLLQISRLGKRGNVHSTVKPTSLMAYLCRLVTPPNGLVLDPFAGSGSTGVGALREGFRFVGIEREEQYVAIAQARVEAAS